MGTRTKESTIVCLEARVRASFEQSARRSRTAMERVASSEDREAAERHTAWVLALRSEYNERISIASEASETSWADYSEDSEMTIRGDGFEATMYDMSALAQPFANLELDLDHEPVYRGGPLVFAEPSGGGLHTHPTRKTAAQSSAQSTQPLQPLLTRQSAPLPFRLETANEPGM